MKRLLDLLCRSLPRVSGRGHQNRTARCNTRPRRPSALPILEMLEDRLTPSTLTVTSSADGGAGSLRAAIAGAGSGDTIVFAKPIKAITLTSGQINITQNLTIAGPGAVKLTVSGNDNSRIFDVGGGVTATISGLTITHGQSTGTLAALGTNTGTGTGAGGGGAILNEAGATLCLNQDVFTNNQAIGAVGFSVLGGAVLNVGTASIQACSFTANQAVGGGAFDAIGGSAGGAIDNFGGATLTLTNSTFSNNGSISAGGNFYYGIGGALENNAGLNGFDPTLAQPSTATISNCIFFNNLATGAPGATANGGALANEGGVPGSFSTMSLANCVLSGNRCLGGGGGDGVSTGNSQAVGGAILSAGLLNITGCTITNNLDRGGDNSVISASDQFSSGAFGGAIENNFSGVLNISNSIIFGNVAQGGAMTSLPGPGGIAVGGGISNSPQATMNMSNCVVSGNSAVGGHGGAGVNTLLAPGQQAGFGFGGGIDISNLGSTATITGSVISGNSAIGGAGGAGNNGSDGLGGGIGVGWGVLVGNSPDGSSLTLINSVLANNLALGGQGGAGANGGNGFGGGLYVGATCSASVTNSQIELNKAIGGSGGKGGSHGEGIGGGLYDLGMFSDDLLTIIALNFATTSNNNMFP